VQFCQDAQDETKGQLQDLKSEKVNVNSYTQDKYSKRVDKQTEIKSRKTDEKRKGKLEEDDMDETFDNDGKVSLRVEDHIETKSTYKAYKQDTDVIRNFDCSKFKDQKDVGLGFMGVVSVLKQFWGELEGCMNGINLAVSIVADLHLLIAGKTADLLFHGLTLGVWGLVKAGWYILNAGYMGVQTIRYYVREDWDNFAIFLGKTMGATLKVILSFLFGRRRLRRFHKKFMFKRNFRKFKY